MKALSKFLFNLYKPTGYLLFVPLLIGAGVQLAGNILPRLIGRKGREDKLEKAGKTFSTPSEYGQNTRMAEGMANNGDPNYNINKQAIDQNQANTISRAKAVSGNVGDILSVLSATNKQATTAAMNNSAQDTAFRFNAKRYLGQARDAEGAAKTRTAQQNFGAQQQEVGRQQNNIQGWAQAAGNVASDIASYGTMKQYGYFGGGGKGNGLPGILGQMAN